MEEVNKGIIYIGGYGRSGSTVLDIVLGSHPELHSLGEFQNFFNIFHEKGMKCPCGAAYADCPEWGKTIRDLYPEIWENAGKMRGFRNRQKQSEHWLKGWRVFFPRVFSRQGRWYADNIGRIFRYQLEHNTCRYVIDSSKSNYNAAWRPLALQRLGGFQVKFIHLVRHPEQVIASKDKLNNKDFLKNSQAGTGGEGWRGLIGWAIANWVALILGKMLPSGSYLLVRYEDLIAYPARELSRIGAFTGVDTTALRARIAAGEPFVTGHLMAGNRTAYKGSLRLEKTGKDAVLRPALRRANAWLNYPLKRIFGYQ